MFLQWKIIWYHRVFVKKTESQVNFPSFGKLVIGQYWQVPVNNAIASTNQKTKAECFLLVTENGLNHSRSEQSNHEETLLPMEFRHESLDVDNWRIIQLKLSLRMH